MMCGFFPQPDDLEVALERLPDQKPGEPSGRPWKLPADRDLPEAVKPLQASETALMFELPADEQGVFFYALHSGAGTAGSGRINLPVPWWTLGDAVTDRTPFGEWRLEDGAVHAGGGLRIVGRCLKLGEREPAVALRSDDGRVTLLQPEKAEPFSLAVTVPEELTPGRYELFVHNGHGGEQAWSEPLDIAVLHREDEKDQPLLDVAAFGAAGDDKEDDTAAIKAALKEAGERGGAVVLVPRGRFVVSEKLVIPPHVTLRGAGRELTALCMADTDDPPDAWIEGSHHFAIEDLTFYCNVISNNTAAAVHTPAAPIEDPETAGHVRLARVRVRADSFRGHHSGATIRRTSRRSAPAPQGRATPSA